MSVTPPATEPAPRSVGRLIPTRLAKLLDPEALKPVPPGEELIISDQHQPEERR